MAKSRGKGFSAFTLNRDADDARRKFIDEPLAAARQPAMETGLKMLSFLAAVPDAVVASRRRELERVRASRRDGDPRIAALEASIEYAGRARTAARLAQTRAEKISSTMFGGKVLFHGFVSNESLEPLPGMTVRIVAQASAGRGDSALTATTDHEGYFSFAGGGKLGDIGREKKAVDADKVTLTDNVEDRTVAVEIADASGTVVQTDPTPLELGGTAYREYIIERDHR